MSILTTEVDSSPASDGFDDVVGGGGGALSLMAPQPSDQSAWCRNSRRYLNPVPHLSQECLGPWHLPSCRVRSERLLKADGHLEQENGRSPEKEKQQSTLYLIVGFDKC